jgi:hypothetical protein
MPSTQEKSSGRASKKLAKAGTPVAATDHMHEKHVSSRKGSQRYLVQQHGCQQQQVDNKQQGCQQYQQQKQCCLQEQEHISSNKDACSFNFFSVGSLQVE